LLAFKCNLYRYDAVAAGAFGRRLAALLRRAAADAAGPYSC
jgi:hypothetical protein